MQGSNIGYQAWIIAIYLFTTGIKGTSSMKLHRDLGITQKSAWYMSHRLLQAFEGQDGPFTGPVEVDGDLHRWQRTEQTRQQETPCRNRREPARRLWLEPKIAQPERSVLRLCATLQGKLCKASFSATQSPAVAVYTDEHLAYKGLPNHTAVKHGAGQFVNGMAHTNGVESFWSMLKRGYHGTFHKMSVKHLGRYVTEFSGRHNMRDCDTIQQMSQVARGMDGRAAAVSRIGKWLKKIRCQRKAARRKLRDSKKT